VPKLFRFQGGVLPLKKSHEGKPLSNKCPIEPAGVPDTVVVPLRQCIGAPCQSLVKKGDPVKMGQLIGESRAFVSSSVHSPVSGTVRSVGMMPTAIQRNVPCVVIENDHRDELDEGIDLKGRADLDALSRDDILEKIKSAGIVGLGGAGFPTHVKLSCDEAMDVLIANGAECEPYSTCDHRLMVEEPGQILRGALISGKLLGVKKVYIAIEENKPDAIEAMGEAVSQAGVSGVEVVKLGVKYPQGSELQLMYTLTGRKVKVGERPPQAKVMVQNVATLHAIAAAVDQNMPLIQRVVTVTGEIGRPSNLRVRVGTPIQELIRQCGGTTVTAGKVIAGGPMTGISQHALDVPVVKTTTTVLVLSETAAPVHQEGPCIRCGRCVYACPAGIQPLHIANYIFRNEVDKARQYHPQACIACGICSFVCPARLPLTPGCILAKNVVTTGKESAV
jgi:electron transport complex protein RnfC